MGLPMSNPTRAQKSKENNTSASILEDQKGYVKSKKERAAPVKWDNNKQWTHRAIDYLLENPSFRLKLFSDSTSNAKEEKRRKVQNGKGKGILYRELALHIFSTNPDPEVQAAYNVDPHKYSWSTQMQFQRWVVSRLVTIKAQV